MPRSLEDATIAAYILEELATTHPDTVDAVFRAALGNPQFAWKDDGEDLLRRHKPDSFRTANLPGTTLVPVFLHEEFQRAHK